MTELIIWNVVPVEICLATCLMSLRNHINLKFIHRAFIDCGDTSTCIIYWMVVLIKSDVTDWFLFIILLLLLLYNGCINKYRFTSLHKSEHNLLLYINVNTFLPEILHTFYYIYGKTNNSRQKKVIVPLWSIKVAGVFYIWLNTL